MKRNYILYLFSTFSFLFLLISCSHETDEFDGPSLVDRFGDFALLETLSLSQTTVDFAAGETVIFSARFNKSLNWVVKVTGDESGAVKIFEGFNDELSIENALWEGGTTILPFFKAERALVELIIPEADSLTISSEVEIIAPKIYEGMLFTDFEEELGSDAFVGNFEFELTNRVGRQNDMPSAQGNWYYLFEGTDNVVPNFFAGLVDIKASVTGETYAPVPTTVPEELYFNVFMYSDGGPHGIAVIQFIYDSNDTGAFEDGQDQAFQLTGDFPLDWTGWRHINHSMSDLGMTQEQVSKIVAIRFLLISDMNSQPNPPLQVDYGVDFITFTEGAPLVL